MPGNRKIVYAEQNPDTASSSGWTKRVGTLSKQASLRFGNSLGKVRGSFSVEPNLPGKRKGLCARVKDFLFFKPPSRSKNRTEEIDYSAVAVCPESRKAKKYVENLRYIWTRLGINDSYFSQNLQLVSASEDDRHCHDVLFFMDSLDSKSEFVRIKAVKDLLLAGWLGGPHTLSFMGTSGVLEKLHNIIRDPEESLELTIVCMQTASVACRGFRNNQNTLGRMGYVQTIVAYLQSQHMDVRCWAAYALFYVMWGNWRIQYLVLHIPRLKELLQRVAIDDWTGWKQNDAREALILLDLDHVDATISAVVDEDGPEADEWPPRDHAAHDDETNMFICRLLGKEEDFEREELSTPVSNSTSHDGSSHAFDEVCDVHDVPVLDADDVANDTDDGLYDSEIPPLLDDEDDGPPPFICFSSDSDT